jgi:hypothetical protein
MMISYSYTPRDFALYYTKKKKTDVKLPTRKALMQSIKGDAKKFDQVLHLNT